MRRTVRLRPEIDEELLHHASVLPQPTISAALHDIAYILVKVGGLSFMDLELEQYPEPLKVLQLDDSVLCYQYRFGGGWLLVKTYSRTEFYENHAIHGKVLQHKDNPNAKGYPTLLDIR